MNEGALDDKNTWFSFQPLQDNQPADGETPDTVMIQYLDSTDPTAAVTLLLDGEGSAFDDGTQKKDVTLENGKAQVNVTYKPPAGKPSSTQVQLSVFVAADHRRGGNTYLKFGTTITQISVAPADGQTVSAPADGTSSIPLLVTVLDQNQSGVDYFGVQLQLTDPAVATPSPAMTDGNGIAKVKITCNQATPVNVTASAGGKTSNTLALTFTEPNTPTVTRVVLKPDGSSTALADGTSAVKVTATVFDQDDQYMKGVSVFFDPDKPAAATPASGTTLDDGTFQSSITCNQATPVNVTASAGGKTSNTLALTFTEPNTPTVTRVVLKPDGSSTALADGTSAVKVTATVFDQDDQHMKGVSVSFDPDKPAAATPASGTTLEDGTFESNITCNQAVPINVTASAGGKTSNTLPLTFTQPNTPTVTRVVLQPDGSSTALADGTSAIKVTATVFDQDGQKMKGVAVSIDPDKPAAATPASGTTLDDGTFESSITCNQAAPINVTASAGGKTSNTLPLTFIQQHSDSKPTTLKLQVLGGSDTAPADGTSSIPVRATLRDQYDVSIGNACIWIDADQKCTAKPATASTDQFGNADFQLTSFQPSDKVTVIAETFGGLKSDPCYVKFENAQPADIKSLILYVQKDHAQTDLYDWNVVNAIVRLTDGSLADNVSLTFTVPNGAIVSPSHAITRAGSAMASVRSLKAGPCEVQVTAGAGWTANNTVHFDYVETVRAKPILNYSWDYYGDPWGGGYNMFMAMAAFENDDEKLLKVISDPVVAPANIYPYPRPVLDANGTAVLEIYEDHQIKMDVSVKVESGTVSSENFSFVFGAPDLWSAIADNALANGAASNWLLLYNMPDDGVHDIVIKAPDNVTVYPTTIPRGHDVHVVRVQSAVAGDVAVNISIDGEMFFNTDVHFNFSLPFDGQDVLSINAPGPISPTQENGTTVFHVTGSLKDALGAGVPSRQLSIELTPPFKLLNADAVRTDDAGRFEFRIMYSDYPSIHPWVKYAAFMVRDGASSFDVGMLYLTK